MFTFRKNNIAKMKPFPDAFNAFTGREQADSRWQFSIRHYHHTAAGDGNWRHRI